MSVHPQVAALLERAVKSPLPPSRPPFSSEFHDSREPSDGKMGWFSVLRVMPRSSVLCVPGGSPNSEVSSTSLNSSYSVRAIE